MTAEAVLGRIDDLGRELAYIEALQERCGDVLNLTQKVVQLARVYRSDRAIVDELSRIRTLMLKPTELYDGIFARLNKRQEKIAEVIKHFHERVAYIREQRDEVHQSLMAWDPILAGWKTIEMTRCNDTEARITELYRFIARHYLTSQSWQQGAA
jgi:5-bromo-4-chloroindolyl phosphate hydrolysis protein